MRIKKLNKREKTTVLSLRLINQSLDKIKRKYRHENDLRESLQNIQDSLSQILGHIEDDECLPPQIATDWLAKDIQLVKKYSKD